MCEALVDDPTAAFCNLLLLKRGILGFQADLKTAFLDGIDDGVIS